ncbi:hypothetical protein [Streptomyces galbus]|uniref:hypothetical protein n=1 Tax=Streptomyces galbus TaxID=33898 RepID=UPI00144AB941|nr:hypothetical protein [Streptomyces galbus]
MAAPSGSVSGDVDSHFQHHRGRERGTRAVMPLESMYVRREVSRTSERQPSSSSVHLVRGPRRW